MMATSTRPRPNLAWKLREIDGSSTTARLLDEAADRIEDLAAENDIVREEVRRLRDMANEYEADADCGREELLEWFEWDEIEKAIEG